MPSTPLTVVIASYLEPELVDRIAAADPGLTVLYQPELVPVPQYRCDHGGKRPELTAEQAGRWADMLSRADIAFDFDWERPAELAERAPRLRWVQATSAGIGGFVQRTGLDRTGIEFTTAGGIHAVPLAEFAVTGALHFIKGVPELRRRQRAHIFERYTTAQLAGRTVTVVGLGGMGRQVVRTFEALGTEVIGIGRTGNAVDLDDVLPRTDVLVLCCPLTPETEGLIGAKQLARLPRGAVLVNIARGPVVDEPALIESLGEGHLGGAALDVFATEPLPDSSPLWDLDNVLVSPHSASTVAGENAALVDLFLDNLRRYRAGEPMRNRYHRDRGY
ncbi:D-2-hydroxyacid dehydrogenase [Actinoplanes sp. Pm04-4]|uniref:D-2-hydroxyacid dehydrogenase n=1 Tax=Paractinoplanes pyxinae TaxID=2997416 RepID=A0ABT4ARX1_9ACTN|nr:D-2-hydroxyacid dehydrogenase [Actinoplanes pyxinae]MCY1136983.1 D-2-hydroxyacid dehydrogenase [Actinoplanes pyxinae]